MKIRITYNKTSLYETAKYIWENNPSISEWKNPPKDSADILQQITKHMDDVIRENAAGVQRYYAGVVDFDEWQESESTCGYTLFFSLDNLENDTLDVSVDFSVDPGLGKQMNFITEILDSNII